MKGRLIWKIVPGSCGMVAGLIHDIPTNANDLIERIMPTARSTDRQRLKFHAM